MNSKTREPNADLIDGQLKARLYFQSLIEHGQAMGRDVAGGASSEAVFDELLLYKRSDSPASGLARLSGFLSFIGEILWEVAEEKRALVNHVEDATPHAKTTNRCRLSVVSMGQLSGGRR